VHALSALDQPEYKISFTKQMHQAPGAVLNGPTMSRPHTADGQVSGMVLRAAAGVFLCLEKR
jgi:hypothetical protein